MSYTFTQSHPTHITTDTPSANPLRDRFYNGWPGEEVNKGKEPAITGAMTRIWSEEDFWTVLQRGSATLKW